MTNARNSTRALSGAAADMLTGTHASDTLTADLGGLDKSIDLGDSFSLESLRDSMNTPISSSMEDPHFKSYVDEMEFMEEQVVVRVHQSSDKNAEAIVTVWNDGKPQRFQRGVAQIVKRKYVEVLARAKPFSVSTPEGTDGNGNRNTSIKTQTGLLYPFEMHDKNPLGQAWLQRVLQEA